MNVELSPLPSPRMYLIGDRVGVYWTYFNIKELKEKHFWGKVVTFSLKLDYPKNNKDDERQYCIIFDDGPVKYTIREVDLVRQGKESKK